MAAAEAKLAKFNAKQAASKQPAAAGGGGEKKAAAKAEAEAKRVSWQKTRMHARTFAHTLARSLVSVFLRQFSAPHT